MGLQIQHYTRLNKILFNFTPDGLDSERPSGVGGGGGGGGGESVEMLRVEPGHDQSAELNIGSNIVTTDLNIM